MEFILYPLIGIGVILLFLAALFLLFFIWPVLVGAGLVGIVIFIGVMTAVIFGAPEPDWAAPLCFASLGSALLGVIGASGGM